MNANDILKNPYPLAPMDGITHSLFRRFMRALGCGFVVSEFVAANEITHQSRRTLRKISFTESERPFGIQIYGNRTYDLVEAARFCEGMGVDFVDINFGCPVKGIVRKGKGSAWLREPDEMKKLLESVRQAIHIPLSIKLRTGFDQVNLGETLQIAEDTGVEWVTVHGRTSSQGYLGQVNWSLLNNIKTRLPLIANGDIHESHPAIEKLKGGHFAGLMIGRRSLLEPRVFLRLQGLPEPPLSDCLRSLANLIDETPLDSKGKAFQLARLVVHWTHGYENTRPFRIKLFEMSRGGQWPEIVKLVLDFIQENMENKTRASVENFMMAGSG